MFLVQILMKELKESLSVALLSPACFHSNWVKKINMRHIFAKIWRSIDFPGGSEIFEDLCCSQHFKYLKFRF